MSSTPGGGAGDSRRRAEIEAKRAKLAELRRAREERSSRIHAGRTTSSSLSGAGTGAAGSSEADTPLSSHRKDLDDLVATLVGPSGSASPRKSLGPGVVGGGGDDHPSDGSGRPSVGVPSSSDYAESAAGTAATGGGTTLVSRADGEIAGVVGSRGMPDMIDVETELFEFPQKEKVYYTKEVQTTSTDPRDRGEGSDDDDDHAAASSHRVAAETEANIRKKILQEQEAERQRLAAENLAKEEAQLDEEIQEELRIMSPAEAQVIFGTTDFTDFVEQSSKIVERALTDVYDYTKDYTVVDGGEADGSELRSVKQTRAFYDDQLCKGRSITGLDWSLKHPELVVASYSRPDGSANVAGASGEAPPDGLVLVWNLHLIDRPEFVFHAQTDVLSVAFSPFHPNLVIGGTYSGQILIWDTRAKQLPVLKTPLSASGHTHPVYNLQVVGTQNANHLITASTDGVVCSWMLDMLAQPQDSLELLNTSHPKTDEVAVTCMSFPSQETTQFWVGTEEGNIYLGSRFDRAGSKAGLQLGEVYRGHSAPVTGLDFHKAATGGASGATATANGVATSSGIVDFSDLFLSASMDWTAKLWRIKGGGGGAGSGNAAATNTATGPLTPGLTSSSSSNAISASASASASLSTLTPLLSFEETSDYVMDVKWHPVNPSIFALVDAGGYVHLHNLLYDLERPVVTTRASAQGGGLNKVSFDRSKEGKNLAVGGADGRVYVLDVGNVVRLNPDEEQGVELQRLLRGLGSAGGTNRTVV